MGAHSAVACFAIVSFSDRLFECSNVDAPAKLTLSLE